jgi:23S rRNA (cytidine2498-2'-O)-methyltransferase
MGRSRVVFSASEDYFPAARQELLAAFGGATIERLGPDTGCLRAEGIDIGDVSRACRQRPIVFVRHLMRELARIPLTEVAADLDRVYETALGLLTGHRPALETALQVWVSGAPPGDYRADELRERVAAGLSRQGWAVGRADREQILSICVTPSGIVLGTNRRADTLTDWPGGRVRLARDGAQVSRAEFKLEELFKVFDIALPPGGVAVDLGASPGGWTRLLRRGGLTVWAVDPADLAPRVAADPGVHHARTTAGRFLAETDLRFDVALNDMRMTAALSCEVMLEAARRLKPGGFAIVTLKISPREPLKTVSTSLRTLERTYEILHARQLRHNRNEVTVVARRREQEAAPGAPKHVRR